MPKALPSRPSAGSVASQTAQGESDPLARSWHRKSASAARGLLASDASCSATSHTYGVTAKPRGSSSSVSPALMAFVANAPTPPSGDARNSTPCLCASTPWLLAHALYASILLPYTAHCCCTLCTACSCKRMLQMTNWAALAQRLRVQRYRCSAIVAVAAQSRYNAGLCLLPGMPSVLQPLAPGRRAGMPSGHSHL